MASERPVDGARHAAAAGEENPSRHLPPLAVAAGDSRTRRLDHAKRPVGAGPDPQHQVGGARHGRGLHRLAIYGGYVRYVIAKGH